MVTPTIPDLPDDVHEKLRTRAERNQRTTAVEARELLAAVVSGGETSPDPTGPCSTLASARAIVRRHVPEGRSIVNEFLAERGAMWDGDR